MMGMGFLSPWFLSLVLPVIALWWLLWRRGRRSFFFPFQPFLRSAGGRNFRQWAMPLNFLMAALFLVAALAGPYWGNTTITVERQSRFFLLINDVSGSVQNILGHIFVLTRSILETYPRDKADLTFFATDAYSVPGVNSTILDFYVSQDGRLRDQTFAVLTRYVGLGGSTNVDRGLWTALASAVKQAQPPLFQKNNEGEQVELSALYHALTAGPVLSRPAAFRPLVSGKEFPGGVAVLVTDLKLSETTMKAAHLLSIYGELGIRLFVIDVSASGGAVSLSAAQSPGRASRQVSDPSSAVRGAAERIWRVRGGNTAALESQISGVFREIDGVTQASFEETRRIRISLAPHAAAAATAFLLLGVLCLAGTRSSTLPL